MNIKAHSSPKTQNFRPQASSRSASAPTQQGPADQLQLSQEAHQPEAPARSLPNLGHMALDPAAVRQYQANGDTQFNLGDREQALDLIRHSPQADDLSETPDSSDQNRCGGAALLNAMLIDGGYEQNSDAIRGLFSDRYMQEHGQLGEALDHMREGQMTPHEAARVQHALYEGARATGVAGEGDGSSVQAEAELLRRLTANGAFPNSDQVEIHGRRLPEGGGHATAEVYTNDGGLYYADSGRIDEQGMARAGEGGDPLIGNGWNAGDQNPNHYDPSYIGDAIMSRDSGGEWFSQERELMVGVPNDRERPILIETDQFQRDGQWQTEDRALDANGGQYSEEQLRDMGF